MANVAPVIPGVLSCLLTQDEETKLWLGHCLDFNLVTSGKSPDGAWTNLRAVIKTHVEHCFTNHRDGLGFRAGSQDWRLFDELKKKQPMMRTEKITLRLVAPETEQIPAFWMQAAESTLLGGGRDDDACAAVPTAN
jgi:hypothetical protein